MPLGTRNAPQDIPWRGPDYGNNPADFDRDVFVAACAHANETRKAEQPRRDTVPHRPGERWNCKACQTPLIGALTKAGKVAPIEIDDFPDATCVLFWRGQEVNTRVVPPEQREQIRELDIPLHFNHFATCPAAKDFRHRES